MTTPTPEQIARLPKWAREHIFRLSNQLGDATSLLLEAATITEDSRAPGVHIGNHLEAHRLLPLSEAHGMRLVFPRGFELGFTIEDEGLTIRHVDRTMDDRLAVLPQAANAVHITTTAR